jgi:hypothetical protein
MTLFPPGTNDQYYGSPAAPPFLALLAAVTILPGSIHTFVPDGGAHSIAGLELGQSAAMIIGLFAWAGATQVVHGLAMLAVALWYRSLVPPMLFLVLLERSIMTLNWWLLKPGDAGHRPPEVYVTLALLPVIAIFLVLSMRRAASQVARPFHV